jgi:hypothetical protein
MNFPTPFAEPQGRATQSMGRATQGKGRATQGKERATPLLLAELIWVAIFLDSFGLFFPEVV